MVICVIPTVFTAYRDHPPPTRCMTGLPAVNSNHRLIISHGNSIISNEIIPASYPYFRICSQTLSTKIGLHPRLHTMLLLVYAITCRRNSASQVHRFVISSEYGSFFSLPSNFVSRHNSTMWDIVWVVPHTCTRMVWLPDGEKSWRYVYSFWHNPRMWQTDRQTDRWTLSARLQSNLADRILQDRYSSVLD